MGIVFGKSNVAEPTYQILRSSAQNSILPYEIRQYGERLAAETTYTSTSNDSPFRLLASYIGVFGTPENEGATAIAMTAPVAMTRDPNNESKQKPTAIAMTSPVAMKVSSDTSSDEGTRRTMTFFLPAEYTTVESVPKPTNAAVTIRTIPASTGAVHRFAGTMDETKANQVALQLAQQLRQDGVDAQSLTDEHVLRHREAWGYDPPFTLPPFRRNEVWIGLSPRQVDQLTSKGPSATLN